MRILLDFQTRLGHAWRIGQRKVSLGAVRLGGDDLYLPRLALRVIKQGLFFSNIAHKLICDD